MSFVKKKTLDTDTRISLGGEKDGKRNPTSVEGYYLGSTTFQSDYGEGTLHVLSTAEGNVGIYARGNMNRILTGDHRGQMVRLSFVGMRAPFKKGRKPSYQYELEYDAENTIDAAGFALESQEPAQDEEDPALQDEDLDSDEEQSLDQVVSARSSHAHSAVTTTDVKRAQSLLKQTKKADRVL